ncbi:MAG: nuclear transport factor 2 family protein [Chthoniobacterales bacterium]|nr:nuclear transport factor 2 family protein [Chthoniobacterales bacterium]
MDSLTINSISNLLFKFANNFDLKKWDEMERCLASQVDCDYTSLRGKKEILTAKEYVHQRRSALEPLQMQHLFSNLEIDLLGEHQAACRCSALILRKREEKFFNTHAIYEFTCVRERGVWLISAIKQTVLWNEGDTEIHSGVAALLLQPLPNRS